jgi:MFS transporter, ACDE family, multidrug resistance protein
LAPYAAGKLVEATNVHVPFCIGASALLLGIGILTAARKDLDRAEQRQRTESSTVDLQPVS